MKWPLNVWRSQVMLILLTKSSNGDRFPVPLHEKDHKDNVCLVRE